MHMTLLYSEFQHVGHEYLNSLLRCSFIISLDLGLPTQVNIHVVSLSHIQNSSTETLLATKQWKIIQEAPQD